MKVIRIVSIVLVLLVVIMFYVPITFNPPGDTRMILDHNTETYIAPPCFESSEATNYLEEATFDSIKEEGYKSGSACTDELLKSENMTLIEYMTSSKWNW